MKKMKKVLSLLLAGILAFSSAGSHVYAANSAHDSARPEDGTTKNQPFASGTGESNNFRIPCLVTLDDGTIVAGCDARWNWSMDGGGLDTIVSRSTDNGKTWNYTFANYLGDNGNTANQASTAFIDPAMATDGETVWMIADLFPAGVALNGAHYSPKTGHTGYDENHNLVLAAATDSVNASSDSAARAAADYFDYHLEKIEGAADDAEAYYEIKDAEGNAVEGYTVDAFFNIKGNGKDTNLFCGDSPYFVYPTDFLYMTKSADGGATWSIPTLIDVKGAEEQTLLVGPGRGTVLESGRLIFTAYEFTNADIASCCIYSDDQGRTWQRGEDVSEWSSEAVVTEADGRLYMFTRHGNAYYTSEDGGATWSPKKDVGIPYWHNCQLSAITYSEKIDGKTAIIFSAPSSATGRTGGKLFVGLVQEDGTLEWPYEYSVNGAGDAYAYSCIDECLDGSIALLYEGGSCPITYENIPIEEIAKGASIGKNWITDAEGNATTSVMMQPSGEAQTFTIHNGAETAEVVLSEEGVVTASYANGQLTVTPVASVKGYHRLTVTVAGVTLYVEVADVDLTDEGSYEKVLLSRGETVSFEDRTGYYVDDVNKEHLDSNIAAVEVTGTKPIVPEEPETPQGGELQAQLATADGQFGGEKIDVKECLYTFTAVADQENVYTISGATADGETAYLNNRGGGAQIPNQSSSANITVELKENENEKSFTFNDPDTENNKNSYLYFYKNKTDKLYWDRFDRDDENIRLNLYAPSGNAPEDSPIKGYKKLESLEEVTAGGRYLIAATAIDGNTYVLHPSLSAEQKFSHVAKVTDEVKPVPQKQTAKAQLATGVGQFEGEKLGIDHCLYTFEAVEGADNQYVISGQTTDKQDVFLHHKGGSAVIPNQNSGANITVAYDGGKGAFSFTDDGSYLYFHKSAAGDNHLNWNRNSGPVDEANATTWFELYAESDDAPEDSKIAGYKKLTALDQVTDTEAYLIAVTAADNHTYVLRPYLNGERWQHVAKVTNETGSAPTPVQTTMEAQLGTDATYSGARVSLESCEYTFTETNAENHTYTIAGQAGDQTAYLHHADGGSAGFPNKSGSADITVEYNADKGAFRLKDADRWLYFYKAPAANGSKYVWDRYDKDHETDIWLDLYVQSDDSTGSAIAGYKKLSSVDELKSGGKYLIAAAADDGNTYILHPSLSDSDKFSHVAKVVEKDMALEGTTTVAITGKAEGETSVKVGPKTYLISVRNQVEKLTLEVGETFTAPGTEYTELTPGQTVVTLTENTDKPPYVQQPELTSGEKYLLGRANHVIVNRAGENRPSNAPEGLAMDAANLNADELLDKMWTVTAKGDGTYSLRAEDGKYLTFDGNKVVLSDTEQALTVAKRANGGFSVSYGGQYLNDWAGGHNYVAGYPSDDNDWYFYAPLEGMILTGQNPGQTEIMFGGTTYQITVICADGAHTWGEWTEVKPQTCTSFGTRERECTICHTKDTEIVSAAHLLPDEWTTKKPASCSEAGIEEKACRRPGCTYAERREIPRLGHQYDSKAEKTVDEEATCGKPGSKSHHCSVCHAIVEETKEEIPATGAHEFGDWETVTSPTCQTEGEKQRTCSVCLFVERETLDPEADNHVWDTEKTVDKAATCTEAGSQSFHCTVEGCEAQKDSEPIKALGHDFQTYVSDENATCLKDGTETASCEREGCEATDTRTVEGSRLEHKYTSYVYQKDATCEADGTEIAECDYGCGMADTRVKEGTKLDHAFESYTSDGNATCTEDGTKTATCKLCGKATDTVADKGSAKGHAWSNWYAVTNPTVDAEGVEERICTRQGCAQKETRAVAKLDPPAQNQGGSDSGSTDQPADQGNNAAQGNSQTAKTGDESNAALYIVLMVAAAAAAGGFFVWKKKKDGKDGKDGRQ